MRTSSHLYQVQRAQESLLVSIRSRLNGLVRRVVLGAITDSDAEDSARFRGTHFGGVSTDGEYMQPYGFASSPPAGSEGIYFKELGVSICADFREGRPAMEAGEVTMWHRSGAAVRMNEAGEISIVQKAGEIVHIGAVSAAALVARADRVESELDSIKTALNTHVHAGVTVGAGSTGVSASGYTVGSVGADGVKVT